jgi:Fic family protein
VKFETFKAGVWQQRYQYKSFEPTLVNLEWRWEDPTINTLLEDANRALGELNAFSLIVPDIDLFIQMHVLKEAQSSSRIEGTHTGIDEALMDEEQIKPEKRDDWREVQNYIQAVNSAIEQLENIPLCNRLIKDAHAILLQGVRGKQKLPGDFRISQNWIGGSSLTDAAFIPPHHDGVEMMMSDLEAFWHNDKIQVPHLVRIAISHYQFETIHPFLDGNGRIGRLLIPLYLISNGLLAKPSLYLSDFFERNRDSYYDALMQVRKSHDMIHWVRFFLRGIVETATKGRTVFREILVLRNEVEQSILSLGKRAQSASSALNLLYRKPIIRSTDLEKELFISRPASNRLINALIAKNILVEITGQQRWRVYAFQRYLNLFIR